MRRLFSLFLLVILLTACSSSVSAITEAAAIEAAASAEDAETVAVTATVTQEPTPSPLDIARGLGLDASQGYNVVLRDNDVTCLEVTTSGACVAVFDTTDKAWVKVQRWDDPEVLASVRSDFEAKFGMTIEDYYQKALDEGRVSQGASNSYFYEEIKYASAAINGIGLGTRVVETDSGVKHLVTYVFRNGGVYGINVAFEGKEGFVQTSMDSLPDDNNPYMYEHPLTYSSFDEMKASLDKAVVGNKIDFALLVRFKNVDSCSEPQGQYVGNVPEKYWQYIGNLCRTPGNYINTESQESIATTPGGEYEKAQNYDIDHLVEQGAPDGGLIATMVGIATQP